MGEIAHVEGPACDIAQANGWLVRKLTYPNRHGAPDRMFIRGGRVVFIEFKDTGKERKIHQKREGDRLLAHGAEYYVIDRAEDVRAIFA